MSDMSDFQNGIIWKVLSYMEYFNEK